jgi:opacity protein-like surface antigen
MANDALFRRPSMSGLCLTLVFLVVPLEARSGAGQQEAESEKIHQLEDRVAQLEQTVAQLKAMVEAANPARVNAPAAANAPEPQQQAPQPAAQTSGTALAQQKSHFEMPPELVPEIGKIGAEVGIFLSASSSPFKLNGGNFTGGYIDLPLFDRPSWLHGKISYEILVGLTQSKTTFTTTSNVAQVSNLAVLDTVYPTGGLTNLQAAVTGTGPAPFPVSSSTQTKLSLLQVIPFALKYTPGFLERYRLRPYAVAGFGPYVTIHVQNPAGGNPANYGVRQNATLPPPILAAVNALYGGQAPFGGPLVAGQISQSPELEARGLPGGHGNVALGYQAGGGLSFRVTRSLSLGFDARYNRMSGTYGSFVTFGSRIGFHF